MTAPAATLARPAAAAAAAAPLALGPATLVVRDLSAMTRFYAEELGFSLLRHDAAEAVLGAGDATLLHLRGDPHARAPGRGEAGLFHLAWLVPSRLDLARFGLRACANGIPLSGSDHLVSEALYLSDPEGNGIEVYADRAPAAWDWTEAGVKMATKRLDLRALAASADGECAGIPVGTILGHVHLKVGAIEPAAAFWLPALGLASTAAYGDQALFMAGMHASGGRYHHHLAVNTWDSLGARARPAGTAGLDHFVVHGGGLPPGEHTDPWGNRAIVQS